MIATLRSLLRKSPKRAPPMIPTGDRVYAIGEVPRELAEAIKASKMDPAHDHLNALMEEK